MAVVTPRTRSVVLAAGVASEPFIIPAGATRVFMQPRGFGDVQVSPTGPEDANILSRYFTLNDGGGYELQANAGDAFSQLRLGLYCGTAETVDFLWW